MITFLNEDLFWASAQVMGDALWDLLVQGLITFTSGIDAIVGALAELAASIVALSLCIWANSPAALAMSAASSEGCCGASSVESGALESLEEDVVIDLAPTAETFDMIALGVRGFTEGLKSFTAQWIAPFAPTIGDIISNFADALDNANICLP